MSLCSVQEGEFAVRTYQLKYSDGGILDQDDLLSDLVEDRDKVGHMGIRNTSWPSRARLQTLTERPRVGVTCHGVVSAALVEPT